MPNPIRYLFALMLGTYVVSENVNFGQYSRQTVLRRFHRVKTAKAFARSLSPDLGHEIVVSDGRTLQTMFVYRPRSRPRPIDLHMASATIEEPTLLAMPQQRKAA